MSKKPAPDAWQPSAEGGDGHGNRHSISPDGTIRIDFTATEVRNNEWFEAPAVTELASERKLLELQHPWHASEAWTGPHDFALHIGKGPGRPAIRVDVGVDAGMLTITRTGKVYPLARAEMAIGAALREYEASLPPSPHPPTPGPPPRAPINWKNLILGTLLGIVFVAAVALGSYSWHESQPPEPPSYPAPAPMQQAEP